MELIMKSNIIRFDWAIKRLLRNKADFNILAGFISELLKEDITIIRLLESESNQDTEFSKFNRVDLLAESSNKELIIIEIQNSREIDYFHRMLFGTSKVITEHITLGEPYSEIKKVYSINIVYFDLGQGSDYIYHGKTDFIGIHNNDLLELSKNQKNMFSSENVYEIFPEYYLLKVNQFDDVAKDSLDEWIYYLKNNEIKDSFSAKGLSEARRIWLYDALPEKEKPIYSRHIENTRYQISMFRNTKKEGILEGREEGLAEGLKQGKLEEKIQIAKNLKASGITNDIIKSATGLSDEEISKL